MNMDKKKNYQRYQKNHDAERQAEKKKKKKPFILFFFKIAALILAAVLALLLLFLILLPKKPELIKGVTYDLKYPRTSHHSQISRKVFENDFKMMKEAGVNTIRLYSPPPEYILDLADKHKIKVIETVVFPGDWTDFKSPYQLKALKREVIRNINRDINRECIYAWSIWNDAPWTYGTGRGDVLRTYGKENVEKFLKEIYKCVKKRDPLRPVTAATLTLNDESRRLGAQFLDILGYNIYLGVTDWQDGSYDPKLAEKMVEELVGLSREYKKPVIITETGYSTYWKREPQQYAISDQIEKIGRKLDGVIFFQWADDWSKAGDYNNQANDVEEHWGLLEADRTAKGGYSAIAKGFSNSAYSNLMYSVYDYFKGGYFAAQKRALKKKWREPALIDKEVEELQNQLNLKADTPEFPEILKKLSGKMFSRKAFDQFVFFVNEFKTTHPDSRYYAAMDYYSALSGWTKLEYLSDNNMWELYYAEKTRSLKKILDQLEAAAQSSNGDAVVLDILFLDWIIQDDLLMGKEKIALEKFERILKSYSTENQDVAPLLTYSKLLSAAGEEQAAERLLREYTMNVGKFMSANDAVLSLKEKAERALNAGDFGHAKIFYDSYLSIVSKQASESDISIAMFDVANAYKRKGMLRESQNVCERLLREYPNSELADDADYFIASLLKDEKSYNSAVKAYKDFISRHPDSNLIKSAIKDVLSIFTIYGKTTQTEKTAAFLNEIVAMYPDKDFSLMARFELASSLSILDRKDEAARQYQYIIDNYPESDYASYSKKNLGLMEK